MDTKRSLTLGLGLFLLLVVLGACNRIAEAPAVELSTQSTNGDCVATDESMLRTHVAGACSTITVAAAITLQDGELVLDRPMTIEGPAEGVTVQRSEGSSNARIFHVASGATVTLSNLIITGGVAHDGGGEEAAEYGGGILNLGTLTLLDCVVTRNGADVGGGISNWGTLSIEDSTITENLAYDHGGGIDSLGGTLTIARSSIADNFVQGFGGGCAVLGGVATITDTTISGNEARDDAAGGLANVESAVKLERSTVSGNRTAGLGGGIASVTIPNEGHHTTIVNSTISGNCAGPGCVTFSDVGTDNRTPPGLGGGIYNWYGLVRIVHSTVTENHADLAGGGVLLNAVIDVEYPDGAEAESKGSIIWGNTSGIDTPDDLAAVNDTGNAFISQGYNLIGAAGANVDLSTAFDEAGDLSGSDPLLGDLLANAPGATATHALQAGSPALDVVPAAECGVATDQRGVARPQGGACDVGAFELQAAPTLHASGFYEPVGAQNSIFVPNGSAPTPLPETVWNLAKGNSTIPLKFNLYQADVGPEITSTTGITFSQTKVECPTSSEGDDPVDFTTAGSTSLRYDTTAGQFVQNWRTPKVSRDTCYLVGVSFPDDAALYAFMRLRK